MQIFTTYPVTIDKKRINASDYYLNADGEEYLPFDGQTQLLGFKDETGEEYFCSVDGENFYNAKGKSILGVFKKIGGGVVKAGKFIGKVAKKVGRGLVQASKKVAKGVKTAGGKVKAGVKKLIHHEKKGGGAKDEQKGRDDKTGKPNRDSQQNRPPSGDTRQNSDVFTKELPLADANTPKENIVDVAGKKFDASSLPSGKEVVQTTDESGKPIAGIEYQPSEVVAVTGADGNVEYHTPDAVGMSKTTIALIVGGSLLVLGIIGFVIYKSRKNK